MRLIVKLVFFLSIPLVWGHDNVDVFVPSDLNIVEPDASRPLLNKGYQEKLKEEYKSKYYEVWDINQYSGLDTKGYLESLYERYSINGKYFGQNKKPWSGEELNRYIHSADIDGFPNMFRKGISLHATNARLLPTHKPLFLDHSLAGEGYPFDYLQNSSIWPSTPLLIVHRSQDRAWYYCIAPFVEGWVMAKDIAFVSEDFISRWTEHDIGVLIEDEYPLEAQDRFLTSGYIGTVLPVIISTPLDHTIMVAKDQGDGNAEAIEVRVSWKVLAGKNYIATEKNFLSLITKLYGSPYGWGGAYFTRDCSALLRDLYAPFGIWLPRNSDSQINAGTEIYNITDLEKVDKVREIRERAIPYLSLIYKPGHIVMYLGVHKDTMMIFHSIWGIRTNNLSVMGRYIVGGTTITTLEPGIDMPHVSQTLLERFTSFNNLVDTESVID